LILSSHVKQGLSRFNGFQQSKKMEYKKGNKERVFSIELKSRRDLKKASIANGKDEGVYLEGTIGELIYARFEENILLEIAGKEGTLRVDLEQGEIKKKPSGGRLQ